MAISQSQKPQTIKTTNPQSSRLAGFVDVTLEDASAWTTADGVKQDRGWAYADGSTLVNTSGKYNSYLARTGSLVLPNGPFRTKIVDESVVSLSATAPSFSVVDASFRAYSDSTGTWYLDLNIDATSSGTATGNINIGGVSFAFNQACVTTPSANKYHRAFSGSGTDDIFYRFESTETELKVSGVFKLDSKPTWADANLESYPVVQLYDSVASGALGLPEASDTQSGIVSTGAQTFAGDKTFTGNIDADSYTGLPAATPTADGVVKKNRWGKQELGAPVTTNATSFLQFDNLTAGQLYRFSGHVAIHRSSGSDNSTSLVRARGTALDTNYWVAVLDPASVDEVPTTTYSAFSIIFEAAASGSIYLETFSFSAGIQVVDVVSLLPATWAQLEELNNYDDTNLGNDFS